MSFPHSPASGRRRLLVAGALPVLLAVAAALYLVDDRVWRSASATRERQLSAAAGLVDEWRASEARSLAAMASLIASSPAVRAALEAADPAANARRHDAAPLQRLVETYQRQIGAPFLLVAGPSGAVLASVGATPRTAHVIASQPAVRTALEGRDAAALLPRPDGILQLALAPISGGARAHRPIGAVGVGFLLDRGFAERVGAIASCEIAFGFDGQVLATTRPREEASRLADHLRGHGVTAIRLGGDDYVVLAQPLTTADVTPAGAGPVTLVLRSSRETESLLRAIHAALALTAAAAVLLALVLARVLERVGRERTLNPEPPT